MVVPVVCAPGRRFACMLVYFIIMFDEQSFRISFDAENDDTELIGRM